MSEPTWPTTPLTHRQRDIFLFILGGLFDHGRPPAIREIMAATGIVSPNGVKSHLKAIARKGYIELTDREARSIRVPALMPGLREAVAHLLSTVPPAEDAP